MLGSDFPVGDLWTRRDLAKALRLLSDDIEQNGDDEFIFPEPGQHLTFEMMRLPMQTIVDEQGDETEVNRLRVLWGAFPPSG